MSESLRCPRCGKELFSHPQDESAVSSLSGDTCPRCGGQLEHSEGLERDYPDCPACRWQQEQKASGSTCPRCGGEVDCDDNRWACTCDNADLARRLQ